ncbi:transcriptional antiterminator [Agrobacterium vitis]|uniref:transcription termination/antitermination NusG family protein n=1 Tax=Agrobacterium vitis TaxID=373 RepID=UPI0012E76F4C|nr:transcription termination/antitermination NusG family protein [Agrobacterium vitis]MVA21114.1 transcriptional antiterminator [Agrobacterium vitis]
MMQHNGKLLDGVSDEGVSRLAYINAIEAKRQRQVAMARRDRPEFDHLARWVVASCKAGMEETIRGSLEQQEIECWCPFERLRLPPRRGKQAVDIQRALFRGYLFVQVIPDNEAFVGLMLASKLRGLMGTDGKPHLMPEPLMRQLMLSAKKAERKHMDGRDVPPMPDVLGKQVTIRSGPFAEFVVTVRKVLSKRGQVVVDVPLFGSMNEITMGIDFISA